MRPRLLFACASLLPLAAQSPVRPETLRYTLNWPSGLTLGEMAWSTTSANPSGSTSELVLEAAIPAFPIRDTFVSTSNAQLCSLNTRKEISHGKKRSEETTTFDHSEKRALRQTKGGGKTELATSSCPRDLLSFLHHVRQELSAGRIPAPQTVYFGAPYAVALAYGGATSISIAGQPRAADRLTGTIKGPASQLTFELFIARDAARTLISARVPIPLGTLSMELSP